MHLTIGLTATGWAAIASGAVAFATLALAAFTYRLMRTTVRSVEVSEALARETVNARVDASAPRLSVLVKTPEWPPYLEDPAIDQQRAEPSHVFIIPRDASRRLWLRTYALLRNEGPTTAFVTLNGSARFVNRVGPFERAENIPVPIEVSQGRCALLPSQEGLVVFEGSRTIQEWAHAYEHRQTSPPLSKIQLEIIATDQFDDGVVDNIMLVVQGYPIEPVPSDPGRRRVRKPPAMQPPDFVGSSVLPVQRRRFRSKRLNDARPSSGEVADA